MKATFPFGFFQEDTPPPAPPRLARASSAGGTSQYESECSICLGGVTDEEDLHGTLVRLRCLRCGGLAKPSPEKDGTLATAATLAEDKNMPKTAPSLEHQVSFTQSSISKPFELPCGHLYHQACLL